MSQIEEDVKDVKKNLKIYTDKDMRDTCKEISATLADLKGNWKTRNTALQQIMAIALVYLEVRDGAHAKINTTKYLSELIKLWQPAGI